MKSKALLVIISWSLVFETTSRADVTVGVDPGANWIGFMNVSELPSNGGAYVFGSVWGTNDLTAVFNPTGSSEPNLTLGPNSVNDPAPFWYTPSGGPGSTGNKITGANMYVEDRATFAGQTVTFSGSVLSNTFVSGYTSVAFIKEFSPSFQLLLSASTPLALGAFSVTLSTLPGPPDQPNNIVQYGFETIGPNVWITDRAPIGTAVVQTRPGDLNRDGHIDAADINAMMEALTVGPLDYAASLGFLTDNATLEQVNNAIARVTRLGDINGDGAFADRDLQGLLDLLKSGGGSLSSVPEPASLILLALGGFAMVAAKTRTSRRPVR